MNIAARWFLASALSLFFFCSPSKAGEKISNSQIVRQIRSTLDGDNSPTPTSTPLIPIWNYSIQSNIDGNSYSGYIVGPNPNDKNNPTATLKVAIVPLILNLPTRSGQTISFDPTTTDPKCYGSSSATAISRVINSPLFTPVQTSIMMGGPGSKISVGSGLTYPDAHLRGSFWKKIGANSNSPYHLKFNVTTLPPQTLTVSPGDTKSGIAAQITSSGYCTPYFGRLNAINVIDDIEKIIDNSNISPDTFVLIVTKAAGFSLGNADDLTTDMLLGFHDHSKRGVFYAIGSYQVGVSGLDTSDLSHEVLEFIYDPYGNNMVPSWGHISQVEGCQNNLEVGDPLSGTNFTSILMPNGKIYHPQDAAFFDWFFYSNSIAPTAVSGDYSGLGNLSPRNSICE